MNSNTKTRIALAIVVLSISACTICMSSQAQQGACDARTVSISVNEANGQAVGDLTSGNFRATLGGQALSIVKVMPHPPIRRIVFMIHTSGGMRSMTGIRASLSLTSDMAGHLPAGTELALIAFADDSYLDQPLTTDRASLNAALHNLDDANKWRGASAVFDAINFGIQKLPQPSDADAIVLISNGIDNASRAKFKDAIQNILNSGVRIFTIGIPISDQSGTDRAAFREGQQHLDELAAASGGESFDFASADPSNYERSLHHEFVEGLVLSKISDVADFILHEMATGYNLEISAPSQFKKQSEWKLEVTGGDNAKCRYPKKLFPCSIYGNQKSF